MLVEMVQKDDPRIPDPWDPDARARDRNYSDMEPQEVLEWAIDRFQRDRVDSAAAYRTRSARPSLTGPACVLAHVATLAHRLMV